MQVEKVSNSIPPKPWGYKPFCTNNINITPKFSNDSVSFGHSIIMPDTQKVITNLIARLEKLGRPLKVNDLSLGEINASIRTRKGSKVWDLILSSARGKGKEREINTYYYEQAGGRIAKESRAGNHNRFFEGEKLDEIGRNEWNNAVQQIAAILTAHLPQ